MITDSKQGVFKGMLFSFNKMSCVVTEVKGDSFTYDYVVKQPVIIPGQKIITFDYWARNAFKNEYNQYILK